MPTKTQKDKELKFLGAYFDLIQSKYPSMTISTQIEKLVDAVSNLIEDGQISGESLQCFVEEKTLDKKIEMAQKNFTKAQKELEALRSKKKKMSPAPKKKVAKVVDPCTGSVIKSHC